MALPFFNFKFGVAHHDGCRGDRVADWPKTRSDQPVSLWVTLCEHIRLDLSLCCRGSPLAQLRLKIEI